MLSPDSDEDQLSALFHSQFSGPNQLKSISCNYYEPEEGINGDEGDGWSDVHFLARYRQVFDEAILKWKVDVPLEFMMRCDYLDRFRGREVEGFYPEEVELSFYDTTSGEDDSLDDWSDMSD